MPQSPRLLTPLPDDTAPSIPCNLIGRYSFKGSVFASGGTGEFCAGNLYDVEEAINVVNDSAASDIDLPAVTTKILEYLRK